MIFNKITYFYKNLSFNKFYLIYKKNINIKYFVKLFSIFIQRLLIVDISNKLFNNFNHFYITYNINI